MSLKLAIQQIPITSIIYWYNIYNIDSSKYQNIIRRIRNIWYSRGRYEAILPIASFFETFSFQMEIMDKKQASNPKHRGGIQ